MVGGDVVDGVGRCGKCVEEGVGHLILCGWVNRFDTMPSKPSLQACRNTVAPSSSVCSLNTIAAQSVEVLQASFGVTLGTICWIGFVFAQARIVTEQRGAIGTDDLAGIGHSEVDMGVILRRLFPNAFELAAANAHDRHANFIVKLGITFHLQRAA